MRIGVFGVIGLGLLTAACGTTTTQRAATGSLIGIGSGALIGGPLGAVVGGVVGGAGGAMMPEGAETLAFNALHQEKTAANAGLKEIGLAQPAEGSSTGPSTNTSTASNQPAAQQAGRSYAQGRQSSPLVKEAQAELQREGLYRGRIDGINGPATQEALAAYQQREGLQQTAKLDQDTLQRMNLAGGPQTAQGKSQGEASGTSKPQQQQGLSAETVRSRLQAEGYGNVSDLRHQADNTYTARAERGDQAYNLRIDARSGQVISQQSVAANQQPGSTPNSGTSTSPGNPNPNAPSGDNTGNPQNNESR